MTEKELKGLSRADLLELLIGESRKVQQLEQELQETKEKLYSKEIAISNAGSIAEASLQLSGIFEAAQAASAQYLENIRTLSENSQIVCARMELECQQKVDQQLSQTKQECEQMVKDAEISSKAYWDEVSTRLEAFYQEHVGLKQLLSGMSGK